VRHVVFSLAWAKKFACADQIVLAESQVVQKASFSPTLSRQDAAFTEQGHSERRGEEVHTKLCLIRSLRSHASGGVLCLCLLYVEPLSDARAQVE